MVLCSEYEIERLIVIPALTVFLKEQMKLIDSCTRHIFTKAMKGELPLLQKAQTLQEELMMLMPEEAGNEPLDQEKMLVQNGKKIALLLLGLAAQKYGKELEKEQEILVNISDMISNVYAMESTVLRTEKAISKTGADQNQLEGKIYASILPRSI